MTKTLQSAGHLSLELISAYVDRELSTDERLAAEQHLAGCHTCTLRVLDAMSSKAATASAANSVAVPADALARLTASLRQQAPHEQEPQKRSARIYSFPAVRWIALAAGLLVAILLIGLRQIRQSDTMSAELLDQHLAVMSSGASPDIISTDRHTVKPWFQGKLPFSFNMPETLPPNITLRGADLVYVDGRPAAMLLFTVGKHQVSVFLIQRTNYLPATQRSSTRSGFNVRHATTSGLHIAAVSDANPSEMDHLVAAITQAQ